jgi:hypothetical protein
LIVPAPLSINPVCEAAHHEGGKMPSIRNGLKINPDPSMTLSQKVVTPAKAGVQCFCKYLILPRRGRITAFAGMT